MFSAKETAHFRKYYLDQGIAFLGPIEDNHANQVMTDLITLSKKAERIQLVIASNGGSTYDGFNLAQFIEQELTVPVDARVWGECSSAATYPLLCCRHRIAHPETTFLVHRQTDDLKLEYDDNFDGNVGDWKRRQKTIHVRQVDFYTRKLKISRQQVEKELLYGTGYDNMFRVDKALRIGLITGVSEL